ncbi:MAG TPA: glycosyltransferase, partial [Chitinophagaceae bacterium]
VVIKFWLPFMGPAFGTILRRIRKNKHTKIVAILDNVIPHEKRPGDRAFIRYFIKSCDAFIAMSKKVLEDLRVFTAGKPARLIPHPLYDNFGEKISKAAARQHLGVGAEDKIILFFGFIRKYKGLDLLLEAMNDPRIRSENIKLIVAGEFYEDEKAYREIIERFQLQGSVILKTDFVPDNQVKYYFCAADAVMQPYRHATQSGITPMAYHFERPMVVTNTGGLPEIVPDGKVGFVTEPRPPAIADAIIKFYTFDAEYFMENIKKEKEKYSWKNMAEGIVELVVSS